MYVSGNEGRRRKRGGTLADTPPPPPPTGGGGGAPLSHFAGNEENRKKGEKHKHEHIYCPDNIFTSDLTLLIVFAAKENER